MRDVNGLSEKAKQLAALIKEVRELASENDYGLELSYEDEIRFDDWLSSSCYGEGSEAFGINIADNSIWEESNC